jgi:gluconate 2-dehydrogenase gamma chain
MTDQMIARRTALKYFGYLAATAAGREFLSAWLPSASAAIMPNDAATMGGMNHTPPPADESKTPFIPRFFKPEEYQAVELLTEMIIPTDDKPGAKEAQVARYIDFVVFSAAEFQPSLQAEWTSGLAWLDAASKEKYGRVFAQLPTADREQLLTEMSEPERHPNTNPPGFEFYNLIKAMTVEGFYTSRVGLIDVLEYKGLDYLAEFPGCTHPEHQG